MINPQRGEAYRFESDPIQDKLLVQIYDQSIENIEEFEIDPNDFVDLYGEIAIERDNRYVQEMEEKFSHDRDPKKERNKKLATVFEAIIDEQIELNDWLGPQAVTIKTSKYDDIRNGVDTVVEFQKEEGVSYLALGIDVTYSRDLGKKISRIVSDIRQGRLSQIKYFESEEMSFRGELNNVPRVIVGGDFSTAKELMALHASKDKKTMKDHEIKFQVVEMIRMQLEAYRDLAIRVGQDSVAKVYQKSLNLIEAVMKEQGIEMIGRFIDGDKVYKELKKQLKIL